MGKAIVGDFLPDNSFPIQFGMFEIEQNRKFSSGNRRVAHHLRKMRAAERFDDLGICNHTVIDYKVGYQLANQLPFVKHRKLLLLNYPVSALSEFDDQGVYTFS